MSYWRRPDTGKWTIARGGPVSQRIPIRLASGIEVQGDRGVCRGCQQPIVWIVTSSGKRTPVDPDGVSHWATCPKAADFKARKA